MILAAALVLVSTAVVGLIGYPSLAAAPWSASSPLSAGSARPIPLRSQDGLPRDHHGVPDKPEPGVDGTTVFDHDVAAVAKLDPTLLSALRRAATDAAADHVHFYVNSGWRSRQEQERLFREAVSKYGSKAEAARWVAVPGTSAHESGDAVDLGRTDATAWLSEHGATYGLCQIYRSEPWHYELRPDAVRDGCPPMYSDPTQDPRMRG